MTTSTSALQISSAFLAIASMGAISSSCQSYRRVIAVRELSGFFADLVAATARADYPLAAQVARMRGLVKGYGDTHARGDAKFGTPRCADPAPARAKRCRDNTKCFDQGRARRRGRASSGQSHGRP